MEATPEADSGQKANDQNETMISVAQNATQQANAGDVPMPDATPSDKAADASSVAAPAKAANLCGVCNVNTSKYKCSRCYLPYCSVACNKTHRENHPPDPEPAPRSEAPAPIPHNATAQPPVDQDPNNPFRALDSSEKLKYLFKKYPTLPDQLLKIHAATLPPADAGPDKRIPASMIKNPSRNNKWNHDIGLRQGKDALRRAKQASGEEGKAIREYSELIVHLLNEPQNDDANTLLQRQTDDQDVKLIETLLAEERQKR
jgi:hypothetical protein